MPRKKNKNKKKKKSQVAHDPGHFAEGDEVVIHSLKAKPEYNGMIGVIENAFLAKTGRWNVRLFTGQDFDLKPTNLTKTHIGDSDRIQWGLGSKVEVFSGSLEQWFPGTITKFSVDEEGEWISVLYDVGNKRVKIKETQRDFEDIRPIAFDESVTFHRLESTPDLFESMAGALSPRAKSPKEEQALPQYVHPVEDEMSVGGLFAERKVEEEDISDIEAEISDEDL